MINVEPRVVRQEIDELLTSGRLERLETVSAHLFQMVGREWKELTNRNVLVHIFHDRSDDVDKLIARDSFKLIFDFVPLSACFTFTCLSRKFVRLSLNKFERTAPAYGFGFSDLREMEIFCAHLDRIRSYAKATLAPSLRATTMSMGNLRIRSPSSTPPRGCLPQFYADTPQRGPYRPYMQGPSYHSQTTSSIFTPSDYSASLYRSQTNSSGSYMGGGCFYEQPLATPSFLEEINEYNCSFAETSATAIPMCDAPDLSKTDANETLPVGDFEDGSTRDRLEAAERRVRALIDAMQPGTIKDMWTTTTQVVDEQPKAPSPCNISENPAGVIGSPVKGKGGIYGRQQTPGQTWQC